jgi:DNA invertase Pin-like site-specific DNA recombinase
MTIIGYVRLSMTDQDLSIQEELGRDAESHRPIVSI